MAIKPINEEDIYDILLEAENGLRPICKRFWAGLKTEPQKWLEDSFDSKLGGFWVVGIFGENIIWYNELEDGFSISKYKKFGKMDHYNAYATPLSEIIEQIVRGWMGEMQYTQT